MRWLDAASTLTTIVGTLSTTYDQFAARRRIREVEERDRRIRELEERIAKLEAKPTKLL